jgi:hypothetical protein
MEKWLIVAVVVVTVSGLDYLWLRLEARHRWHGRSLTSVAIDVLDERRRQDQKWGIQNHPDVSEPDDPDYVAMVVESSMDRAEHWKAENARRVEQGNLSWDGILLEEVYEALAETDPERKAEELIQVAAVAQVWVECIDRRLDAAEVIAGKRQAVLP